MKTVKIMLIAEFLERGWGTNSSIADHLGVDPSYISNKLNDPDFYLFIEGKGITHWAKLKSPRTPKEQLSYSLNLKRMKREKAAKRKAKK